MTTDLTPPELKARLKALGLFGLISCCDEIIDKPWLREVLAGSPGCSNTEAARSMNSFYHL